MTTIFDRAKILSPRLQAILELGVDGSDFWDICCDHGYLGEAALASGRFHKVHFVDQVPHIIERLRSRLAEESSIHLCAAECLHVELTGTLVVAGVGGHNIIKMLGNWSERGLLRAERLLLNPLTHIRELRSYLPNLVEYKEVNSILVREREREREILILEPSTDKLPSLSGI